MAVPISTPRIRPSASATATVGEELVHDTVDGAIGALNWSKPATVVVTRSPDRTVGEIAVISNRARAGAGVTDMATDAVIPEAVPVIVAFPGAMPRTCPPASTLATAELLEIHDTTPTAICCPF